MALVTLEVNGIMHSLNIDPATPLLWVLRDHLGLEGTKFGCGVASCGACTVQIDNIAMRSCIFPVSEAAGKKITTIEGLSTDASHPVQRAWLETDVAQCGYCQAGQIMSAAALLQQNPSPTDNQIERAMSGNICRCGTYLRIKQAVKTAATIIKE
jgi:isoquinoline 1-oxidoreductase alpha subunit